MTKLALFVAISSALALSFPAQAANPDAGKEKSRTCAACHGPDGNSPAAEFPKLAGQHYDYLVKSLKDYKSGARKNAALVAVSTGLLNLTSGIALLRIEGKMGGALHAAVWDRLLADQPRGSRFRRSWLVALGWFLLAMVAVHPTPRQGDAPSDRRTMGWKWGSKASRWRFRRLACAGR